MTIIKPKKIVNDVRAYAKARSTTDRRKNYLVVRTGIAYRCACPDYLFRGRECKHIKEFKKAERGNR